MKLITKNLQGIPLLIKVCTDPLTEGNIWNFTRGSRTEISFFVSLVKVVSVPLTEENNWNFARGYRSIFLGFFVEVVLVSLTESNNRNFSRGFPIGMSFFVFFGQRDKFSTRQAGLWIDFHFSDSILFILFC